MTKLFAQIDGPGGAYITSSRWSKSEEMSISFRIDQPEVDINKPVSADARQELGRRIRELQRADYWLAGMSSDPVGLKRALAQVERTHPSIDARIGDSIRKLYDDRLMREINNGLFRTMQVPPADIPIAFSKAKLIETVEKARHWAREASWDPAHRFMLAVQNADLVWEIFPDAKREDDPNTVYPTDAVRAPERTVSGGTYGLMMGIKVIVDSDMADKWELRDSETGDKIRFVENPDQPGTRYYFDPRIFGGDVNDGS